MNDDGTYPQFKVSGVKGHFGGSLDAIVILPPKYEWSEPIAFSYKTKGTGSGFTKLQTNGVVLTAPEHHAQESTYCRKMNFQKYGYRSVNKNDDDHYITIQDADFKEAERLEARAEKIIFSRTPPARISENKSFFDCARCHFNANCHDARDAEMNCRSCKYAFPIDDGQWLCEFYNQIIPKKHIPNGCPSWSSILRSAV
jgi:uncharacterized protein YbaR (Trm112 family)